MVIFFQILKGNCSSWSFHWESAKGICPYSLQVLSLPGGSFSVPSVFNVLQPLFQHMERWPCEGVQAPAELHDVVDHVGAAIWGLHPVALLHARNYVLQGLVNNDGGIVGD